MSEVIVEAVDVSATLCELAGLEVMETSDGKDITGLLHGKEKPVREIGVTEFAWSKSVRKGKYRLVYYPKEMFAEEYPEEFGELYDLKADPWEMRNLFFEEEYTETVAELQGDLLNWTITTTRPATIHAMPLAGGEQYITRFGHSVNRDGKINPKRIKELPSKKYL
jgi:choline-sulfatase/uncharacterized sulfatase